MRSKHDYRKGHEDTPTRYFLHDQDGWEETCTHVMGTLVPPKSITVYCRTIKFNSVGSTGAARFDFSELCGEYLGPADYLSIASTFPIVIIDNVPIMTLLKKNEARSFITLLDALYECRVKLLIRAASSPDTLFFPDADNLKTQDNLPWMESYTKAQLDMTTPYRPNVSTYTGGNEAERVVHVPLVDRPVDLSKLTAFTGEDERFAFRRAVSGLYEMPSQRWWETQTHMPLNELSWCKTRKADGREITTEPRGRVSRDTTSPFRVRKEKPPSFFDGHFWGIMRWGRKAGQWGMGIVSSF